MNTAIQNEIVDALIARLNRLLNTNVDDDDETWAGLVRGGNAQEDTAVELISLYVHIDAQELHHKDNGIGLVAEISEMSGPYYRYLHCFNVEFSIFLEDEADRDNGRRRAQVVVARAKHAINTLTLDAEPDSYGEFVYSRPVVVKAEIDEGGGEGDFIYRGEMKVVVPTSSEPDWD